MRALARSKQDFLPFPPIFRPPTLPSSGYFSQIPYSPRGYSPFQIPYSPRLHTAESAVKPGMGSPGGLLGRWGISNSFSRERIDFLFPPGP